MAFRSFLMRTFCAVIGHNRHKRFLKTSITVGIGLPFVWSIVALLSFIGQIQVSHRPPGERADAIVVLSGDPERMPVALSLLKNRFGRRILFAGQDNSEELKYVAANPSLACCIDFDSTSKNTVEDAIVVQRWVLARRVRSLILVTTDYHVPRAMIELRRVLPETHIRPFGVETRAFDLSMIWQKSGMARRFLSQFIKFAAASLPVSTKSFDTTYFRKISSLPSEMESGGFVAYILLILTAATVLLTVVKLRPLNPHRAHKRNRDEGKELAGVLLCSDARPVSSDLRDGDSSEIRPAD